jgi:bifunctional DNase/RNase
VLIEEKGERRIPIIIGGFEAQSIVVKLENLDPPRPLTHDLFKSFADVFNVSILEVFIDKLEDGVFYAKLICSNGNKEYTIDSRTSDAVALSLRFDCPIFITEEILEKAGITVSSAGSASENISAEDSVYEPDVTKYNSYTDEELYKMIDEAVKTEDYERAATIRDEIEKRKKL